MKEEINSALIVAQRPEIRDGLRALLMATPQIGSIRQVANSSEALQIINGLCPTLVLVDAKLIHGTILELLEQIKIECPSCRCIVLIDEAHQRNEAESAGAEAVLLKGCPTGKLLEAISSMLSNSATDAFPQVFAQRLI